MSIQRVAVIVNFIHMWLYMNCFCLLRVRSGGIRPWYVVKFYCFFGFIYHVSCPDSAGDFVDLLSHSNWAMETAVHQFQEGH